MARPRLAIVIPALNEEKTVGVIVEKMWSRHNYRSR